MLQKEHRIYFVLQELPAWKSKQETGRLIKLLATREEGFCKESLLEAYYEDYARSSVLRQSALQARLSKLLQRARARFQPHGVQVKFDPTTRRWSAELNPVEVLDSRKS